MRTLLLALAATTAAGVAAIPVAEAQPLRTRVYAVPYSAGLDADEIRDYQLDQLERRHEMQRDRLRMYQRVERRIVDPDED